MVSCMTRAENSKEADFKPVCHLRQRPPIDRSESSRKWVRGTLENWLHYATAIPTPLVPVYAKKKRGKKRRDHKEYVF